MQMTGEHVIPAPRAAVWQALNDPEVLKQCIPGCETITQHSETEMEATVRAKVGPVSARFAGAVTLSELDPPNGYRISGEGKGGAAGFAKGGATVKLTDVEGGTLLAFEVDAQVGGKLAQIGSRLIDATAKKMAGDFFEKFGAIVAAAAEAAAPAAAPESAAATPAAATHDHSHQGSPSMSHGHDDAHSENVYPNTHWAVWLSTGIAGLALLTFIFKALMP